MEELFTNHFIDKLHSNKALECVSAQTRQLRVAVLDYARTVNTNESGVRRSFQVVSQTHRISLTLHEMTEQLNTLKLHTKMN